MINCTRDELELAGTTITLLEEFRLIANSLRKSFLHNYDAESVRKMMDAAYNIWEEEETC